MTTDVQIVQRGIIGKGSGYDHYIFTDHWVDSGSQITISDIGSNNLHFVFGFEIVSSMVTSNAFKLTLSNGAEITVLDAANYDFSVGGNPLLGDMGFDFTYQDFASEVLGVEVPFSGVATGGEVKIDESIFGNTIDVQSGVVATGTDKSDTFVVDLSFGGNFQISSVDMISDEIKFIGLGDFGPSTLADLVGEAGIGGTAVFIQENPFTGSVLVNLGLDEKDELISLEILNFNYSDVQQLAVDFGKSPSLPDGPDDTTYVEIEVSSDAPINGTAAAEKFIITVDSNDGGQFEISNFDVTNDSINLSGLTGVVADTLAELEGQQGFGGELIFVHDDPFAGSHIVNLGFDSSGEVILFELGGVTQDDLSAVAVSIA